MGKKQEVREKKKLAQRVQKYYKNEQYYKKLLENCKRNIITSLEIKEKSKKKPLFRSHAKNIRMSFGERIVYGYLIKRCIKFKREVEFYNLPLLRFDFYLINRKTVIEFDGIQHFETVDEFDFGDKDKLVMRKKNDRKKDKYCKDNGISMIRIPYTKIKEIPEYLNCIL